MENISYQHPFTHTKHTHNISTPHLSNIKHNSFHMCHYATYTGAYRPICYPLGPRGRAPMAVWSGLHPCAPLASHSTCTLQLDCTYIHRPVTSQASRGFVSDSWAFLLLMTKCSRQMETSVIDAVTQKHEKCRIWL